MKVVLAGTSSAGKEMAKILGATTSKKGYLEGNGYVVTWTYGHIIQLLSPSDYDESLNTWSLEKLPFLPARFKIKLVTQEGIKEQFNIIKNLCVNADEIICATDPGREGQLIFDYIMRALGSKVKEKTKKRLWVHSLTEKSIREGFRNLRPLSDFDNLASAARARSEADWLVRLNSTRAYTVVYSGGSGTLSLGRVQTPVLALIVKRTHDIAGFVSSPFWEINSFYKGRRFKAKLGKFKDKGKAQQILSSLKGKDMYIEKIEEELTREKPPKLFDLTTLQREMNRKYKLSSKTTLGLLQELYESKLVSYPRTDSRYLSDDLYPECREILEMLKVETLDLANLRQDEYIFNNSKVINHHALIPTGETAGELSRDKECIYREIVNRFTTVFHEDCVKEHTKITAKIGDYELSTEDVVINSQGWKMLSGKSKDVLPKLIKGEHGAQQSTIVRGKTKPASGYTEDTLLDAMETCDKDIEDAEVRKPLNSSGIGTPATRADIIQTLIKRAYISIKDNKITPSERGIALIDCIKDESIKSLELTGEWEMMLKRIEEGSMDSSVFLNKIKVFITKVVDAVKSDNNKQDSPFIKLASASALGKCPSCKALVLERNKTYSCAGADCKFVVWKSMLGKTISTRVCKEILTDGKSRLLKGFTPQDKSKPTFSAHLVLNEAFEVKLEFPKRASLDAVGDCPLCNDGKVMASENDVFCLKGDCDYVFQSKISNKILSLDDIKELVSTGSTGVITGLKAKNKKTFSAKLVYNKETKKTEFVYNKPGKKQCD